jgi:hypothetical protein
MSSNISATPYLRNSRNFPQDAQELSVELSKTYIDIAESVNARVIGFYATLPTSTGNVWFVRGARQQTVRQLFPFTAAGNIPHGINWAGVFAISPNSYGSYTDGTNWYGVPFTTPSPVTNQITFYVTPTNIVVVSGGAPPTPTQGYIVLEWVSNS